MPHHTLRLAVALCLGAAVCSLAGCKRKILIEEKSPTPPSPAPASVTSPAPLPLRQPDLQSEKLITLAPDVGANMNIQRGGTGRAQGKVYMQPAATLPPKEPIGTVEMSRFKPFKEDVREIKRVRASHITTDATGLMTLSGDAVVEVQHGVAVAKLIGDEIKIQTGPGFKPEIRASMND